MFKKFISKVVKKEFSNFQSGSKMTDNNVVNLTPETSIVNNNNNNNNHKLNKNLFNLVFKNIYLKKIIFRDVRNIHLVIFNAKTIFRWEHMLDNPEILAYYNYIDHLKNFTQENPSFTKYMCKTLETAAKQRHYNILQVYWDQLLRIKSSKRDDFILQWLEDLIKNGDLKSVQEIVTRLPKDMDTIYLKLWATKYNQFDILKWLHTVDDHDDCFYLHNATEHNNLEMVEWIMEKRLSFTGIHVAIHKACELGYLDIIEFLDDFNPTAFKQQGIDIAAKYGHMDIIEYLHENRPEGCTGEALTNAAESGYLDIVKWLLKYRSDEMKGKNIMAAAAAGGHLNIIKWAIKHKKEQITPKAIEEAARHGQVEILQYFHQNLVNGRWCVKPTKNIPGIEGFTPMVMTKAVENGKIDATKWLIANRYEGCSPHALKSAIQSGYFEIAKLLFEGNYCIWNDPIDVKDFHILKWFHENYEGRINVPDQTYQRFFDLAMESNEISTIDWFHRHQLEWVFENYQWNNVTKGNFAIIGAIDTLEWFYNNNRLNESYINFEMLKAADCGNIDVFRWLKENEIPTPENRLLMDIAAENGHYDLLVWLHENRTDGCTPLAIDKAAERGYLHIIKFLHSNRNEGCTQAAVDEAYRKRHYHIAQWLLINRAEGGSEGLVIEIVDDADLEMFILMYKFVRDSKHLIGYLEYTFLKNATSITDWLINNNAKCRQHSLAELQHMVNELNYEGYLIKS